jgi:hypothetical protein
MTALVLSPRPRRWLAMWGVPFALVLALTPAAAQPLESTPDTLAQVNVTFRYTGNSQTWAAPSGVTRATFAMFGAQGGVSNNALGGNGGWAVATLDVSPGATYQINVGGRGGDGSYNGAGAGGFNGGGAGGGDSAGGGGASDVRGGSYALDERLLVAAGGGGGGFVDTNNCGGAGYDGYGGAGGQQGGNAYGVNGNAALGGGGAQPGAPGTAGQPSGSAGASGAGGAGAGLYCGGAGGGGGYYGGGGGGWGDGGGGGGGGGGSSYGPPGTVFQNGTQIGDGQVLVAYTPPPATPTPAATSTPTATNTPAATNTPIPTPTSTPTTPATATSTPTPPATDTPTPTRPAGGVSAQITGCPAQGSAGYTCSLRVTLGAALAVDTVLSMGISGGEFANPSGTDRPQVSDAQGCTTSPIPSPYLADDAGNYTRYDVNISSGGCQAGATLTFGEAVTGTAAATITQTVSVPGFDAAKATFVLP